MSQICWDVQAYPQPTYYLAYKYFIKAVNIADAVADIRAINILSLFSWKNDTFSFLLKVFIIDLFFT